MNFRKKKVSQRGLIIIVALLISVMLGSRPGSHTPPHQANDPTSQILAMLSKTPNSAQKGQDGQSKTANKATAKMTDSMRLAATMQSSIAHKSGTLNSDQIWNAESTYLLDDAVVVPEGKTLTIEAGTTIKIAEAASGIRVERGGELYIEGGQGEPVVITSYRDDAVAGDTDDHGSSTGKSGDYASAITVADGAKAMLNHLNIFFATTALTTSGDLTADNTALSEGDTAVAAKAGEATLRNITIQKMRSGIENDNATVVFRGALQHISGSGMRACNWGGDCVIDAAYSEWQGAAPDQVCGQVFVSPWTQDGAVARSSFFASKNCDSTSMPLEKVTAAAHAFMQRADTRRADCNPEAADACQAHQAALACIDGSMSALAHESLFAFPDSGVGTDPVAWTTAMSDAVNNFGALNGPTQSPKSTAISIVRTLQAVTTNFQTCTP